MPAYSVMLYRHEFHPDILLERPSFLYAAKVCYGQNSWSILRWLLSCITQSSWSRWPKAWRQPCMPVKVCLQSTDTLKPFYWWLVCHCKCTSCLEPPHIRQAKDMVWQVFQKMLAQGTAPTTGTFASLLTAASHSHECNPIRQASCQSMPLMVQKYDWSKHA